MFSNHIPLSPFSAVPNRTAPHVLTHHLLPTLHTLNKEEKKVNIQHHGNCPDMGASCPKEKTSRIPANGMRSKLGAVRRSATSPCLLLMLFSVYPSSLWV